MEVWNKFPNHSSDISVQDREALYKADLLYWKPFLQSRFCTKSHTDPHMADIYSFHENYSPPLENVSHPFYRHYEWNIA